MNNSCSITYMYDEYNMSTTIQKKLAGLDESLRLTKNSLKKF